MDDRSYPDYSNEPENWNENAGLSAVGSAMNGNWELLRERLADPSIALTMLEREWLSRQRLEQIKKPSWSPTKNSRPKEAREPELYYWFRQAEGLERADAVLQIGKTLGRVREKDKVAIEKALARAGWDNYDPGPGIRTKVKLYKDGNRAAIILPPELAHQEPDLMEFLSKKTKV